MKPSDIFEHHAVSGNTVITLQRHLNLDTAQVFRDKVVSLIGEGSSKLIVDLTSAPSLNNVAIGSLLNLESSARKNGGRLALVCNDQKVLELLERVHLDQCFQIFSTVDSAVAGAI
jgi:anti-sigma B factor antagonist